MKEEMDVNGKGPAWRRFIEGMPKAALHIHIEGSLEPELAFEIATRNGIEPGSPRFPYASAADLKKAYAFSDLRSFLDLYYTVSKVLLKKRDFRDLAAAYCRKAIAENVRHAEIFFDPQSHTSLGIPFKDVADGINEALAEARRRGLSTVLIASILRDSPVGSPGDEESIDAGFDGMERATGWATVRQVVRYNETVAGEGREGFRIRGIGLDSNEKGYPPGLFTGIYAFARENGLHSTAHAGEEGPPDYIWEALRKLACVRIDHGVRCMEDDSLVSFLAAIHDSPEVTRAYHMPHRIPLTVCPLSNYELKVFPDPASTNILRMLDRGILATVNPDDPAYFRGYVTENYLALLDWLGPGNPHSRPITPTDIYGLCLNGFEASWLPLEEKGRLIAEAADYFLREPGLL